MSREGTEEMRQKESIGEEIVGMRSVLVFERETERREWRSKIKEERTRIK